MELIKQTFEQAGENDFSIEGSYSVTIETMLKSVMRWELVLKVPGPLVDRAFYQVYAQIDGRSGNVGDGDALDDG